jgi:hypothetical protein
LNCRGREDRPFIKGMTEGKGNKRRRIPNRLRRAAGYLSVYGASAPRAAIGS